MTRRPCACNTSQGWFSGSRKVKAIILFGVREKFADPKVARAPYLFSLALTGFEYIKR